MRIFSTLLLLCLFGGITSCLDSREDIVDEPVAPDYIFSINGVDQPYNFGYDTAEEPVANYGEFTAHQYELVLTTKDVSYRDYLTGTSDMLAINLMSMSGPITDLYINFSDAWDSNSSAGQAVVYGRFCEQMNFAEGTADEDESLTDGTLDLKTNEDGSQTLTMYASTREGRTINGSWTGYFIKAKTSR